MGLGWRGDDVVLVPAFVGLVGGMVQESTVVVVGSDLTTIFGGNVFGIVLLVCMAVVMGSSLIIVFGGRVFGPSLRACMVLAIGPSLTTIFDGSVFGPILRACFVLAMDPSLIIILGGRIFGPMPMPMDGWNFGLRGSTRLRNFPLSRQLLVELSPLVRVMTFLAARKRPPNNIANLCLRVDPLDQRLAESWVTDLYL